MFWSFCLNESVGVARFMRINLGIIELYFLIKTILAYQVSASVPLLCGICICNSILIGWIPLMALEGCQYEQKVNERERP